MSLVNYEWVKEIMVGICILFMYYKYEICQPEKAIIKIIYDL